MSRSTDTRISFRNIFYLTYVFFFLYLLGDAMYRWSGFRFYGSFDDFLPSVALITIFWSIFALCSSAIAWVCLRAFEWLCLRVGHKVQSERVLIFAGTFILLGAITWVARAKILIRSTSLQEELLALICIIIISAILTRILRNKAEQWIDILIEKIVPLVWLFGIWTLISVPLVGFHTFVKSSGPVLAEDVSIPSATLKRRPNIIMVTFDTLTARDMSLYGYQKETTPFITEWAKSAAVFTRLEAESNVTKPTTSSLMTGKRLWTHRVYHNIEGSSNPLRSETQNLGLVLRENGYFTMGFIANPFASLETLGISDSFDINIRPNELRMPGNLLGWIDNFLYKHFSEDIAVYNWIIKDGFLFRGIVELISVKLSKTEVPPVAVFNKFFKVLDNKPSKPYFAWLHIFPPHTPYLPPEPYLGMFDSKLGEDHIVDWDMKRARYDEFIRYCDNEFQHFIKEMKKRGELKNTIIIFSSDHGESFEHNYLGHGGPHLFEQVTHVPLIIKDVDQKDGLVINDMIEQIDITATILELSGSAVPEWIEGRSIVPLMRKSNLASKPVFSMSLDYNSAETGPITLGTIAVWKDEYKLIHYLQDKKSLLFNLKLDPAELNNLIEHESEVGQHLFSLIKEELDKANKMNRDTY